MAGEAVMAFGGCAIAFRDAAPAAEALAAILRGWPVAPGRAPADIVVTGGEGGLSIVSPWLEEPIGGLTPAEAACSLAVDLVQDWLARAPELLCLHCGAVEIRGRLLVFTGPSRAGKSTLAARLAAGGARLFCDDALPLMAERGLGLAPGVAPRLRVPIPPGAGAALRDLVAARAGPSDARYLFLDPPGLAARGETAPIGAVLLLDRRESGPARLLPARPEDAMRLLVSQNLARDGDPALIVDRLAALHARAPALRLVYSDLDEAADLLAGAFADWSDAARLAAGEAEPFEPWLARSTPAEDGAAAVREVSPDARCVRAPNVAVRRLADGAFLCDPREQAILHLNAVGAGIWRLLDEPVSVREAADLLCEAFPEVPRETVVADVAALFRDLLERRLVSVVD